jgi:hypothetical protein
LFILPEKAKTIKEKLRLLIYGSHGLKIKNVFSFFLIIFIILLVLMHFFAYDSVSSSLGVGEFPEESRIELGSLKPGKTTTTPRKLPVINPGVMPVKGFIFGSGDLREFVNRATFEVDPGTVMDMNVTASAPVGTVNGSYVGEIMVYSSPLWFMFPDEFMESLYQWNPEVTIMTLDVISACVLTVGTVLLIVLLSYLSNKYVDLNIDYSWQHAAKLFFKKGIGERIRNIKVKTKKGVRTRFGWIAQINLAEMDTKPLLLGSLLIIPLLLLLNSEILAMVIASLLSGLVAYLIKCEYRKKIVFASVISMMIGMGYILWMTNYSLFTGNRPIIEAIALGMGAIGVYLLVLALLIIPLAYISWYIVHLFRNVKERKDPLLILEGRCDL